jgi:hypothetical protein
MVLTLVPIIVTLMVLILFVVAWIHERKGG